MNTDEKLNFIIENMATKHDVATLIADIAALHQKMEHGFKDTRSEFVDVVNAVGSKVDALGVSLQTVRDATAQNSVDVQAMRLKNA